MGRLRSGGKTLDQAGRRRGERAPRQAPVEPVDQKAPKEVKAQVPPPDWLGKVYREPKRRAK
jgi:hypothetical protein